MCKPLLNHFRKGTRIIMNFRFPREQGTLQKGEGHVFRVACTAERHYWLHGLLPPENGRPRKVFT
jgi:hypothetical protein